jgi:DNA-binding transcriptional MerR regulator
MDRWLTIGQVAELSGVPASTIRYYERLRLLPDPQRTAAGYRLYSKAIVHRLNVVRNAQRFGFSLAEITKFLQVRDAGGKPCHDVRAKAQGILDAVDGQIKNLLAALRRMRRTLREWDRMLTSTPADRPAHLLETLAGQGRAPDRWLRNSDRLVP